jgi:lipopolysaccharide export system protein LptA
MKYHCITVPLRRFCSIGRGTRAVLVAASLVPTLALLSGPAAAEKADRYQLMAIESDQGGKLDLQRQVSVFTGNVLITKGTMTIRAARVEARQDASGYSSAVAFGSPGHPVTFRQKRDGADEFIEGEAERLEYDGRTDTIRFVTNAAVRRLRGATPADELTGNLITYNAIADEVNVSGGTAPTPTNPTGRVRVVLTPREGSEAAAEAARAASQAAPSLRTSPGLGSAASAPPAGTPR